MSNKAVLRGIYLDLTRKKYREAVKAASRETLYPGSFTKHR
jgi:hypothetical protein